MYVFTAYPTVGAKSNLSQALRALVLRRKISGPTQSLRGDQFLSHGFTVHETCLRQGVDLWQFMPEAVTAFIGCNKLRNAFGARHWLDCADSVIAGLCRSGDSW